MSRKPPRDGTPSPPPETPRSVIVMTVGLIGGVALLCGGLVCGGLSWPAYVQSQRDARHRDEVRRQRPISGEPLLQLGLAFHNYHEAHRSFPIGGTYTEEGEPRHGWMTALLPHIDQQPLYDTIDMNKPWNDQTQRAAFQTVIPNFVRAVSDNRITAEGYGAAHFAANELLFGKNFGVKLNEISDGTSTTCLAGEIREQLPAWGQPDNRRDVSLGLNISLEGFGSLSSYAVMLLMADGSVRFVPVNVDASVLKALATPSGRESIPEDF